MFVGSVIMESLADATVLDGWTPVAEKVSDMPDDPDAKVWHTRWYRVSEAELKGRLDRLAAAMRPQWYAHFWQGDDLCVILAGRAFWLSIADRSTWAPMQAYGDTVGIERKWTAQIPTYIPDYVMTAIGVD